MTTSAPHREEAGTDEVAALAAVLAPPVHVAVRPEDDEEDVLSGPEPRESGRLPAAVPRQPDEFTCRRCFLVAHVSRRTRPGVDVCRDCG